MAVLTQDFAYAQILHANDGSSKVPKYLPNFDWFYGPYVSKEAAFAALSSDKFQMCIGKTVGIIENGTIVEYWFESACSTIDDLVEKNSVSELTEDQMEYLMSLIEQ